MNPIQYHEIEQVTSITIDHIDTQVGIAYKVAIRVNLSRPSQPRAVWKYVGVPYYDSDSEPRISWYTSDWAPETDTDVRHELLGMAVAQIILRGLPFPPIPTTGDNE